MRFLKGLFSKKISFFVLISCVLLTNCTTDSPPETVSPEISSSHLGKLKKLLPQNSYVQGALGKIKEGNLEEASRLMNIALQNFPKQAYLHILNGVIYERMGDLGYDGKAELAGVAYQNAINLDPTNWHAIYFSGRIKLKNLDYATAQEFFANALLLKPNDATTLHDLAVASYYARDLAVARSSIQKALQLNPNQVLFHRSASMIFAATGEKELSQKHFTLFTQKMNQNDPDISHMRARLQDWNQAHTNGKFQRTSVITSDIVDTGTSSGIDTSDLSPKEGAVSSPEEDKTYPVIILDCYLLQVSEESSTSKGWNILSSFKNALGNTVTPSLTIHPRDMTSVNQKIFHPGSSTADPASTLTNIFSRGFSFGELQYNLNIANASDKRVEILGRPTLSAFLNKKATFSSGEVIKGGIQGTVGGSLGEIPTGVQLEVTPTQIVGNDVTLDISLEGSLLGEIEASVSFTSQLIRLAKTKVVTTMRLGFGETGMLGGMYERTDQYDKSGVPLLQDIPGVQYLFSNEITDSLRKSVLFLVTPRRTEAVYKQVAEHFKGNDRKRWEKQPSLHELLTQDGGAWNMNAIPPALITILHRMEGFYYQFRTGDLVSTVYWGIAPTLEDELHQISAFLYY